MLKKYEEVEDAEDKEDMEDAWRHVTHPSRPSTACGIALCQVKKPPSPQCSTQRGIVSRVRAKDCLYLSEESLRNITQRSQSISRLSRTSASPRTSVSPRDAQRTEDQGAKASQLVNMTQWLRCCAWAVLSRRWMKTRGFTKRWVNMLLGCSITRTRLGKAAKLFLANETRLRGLGGRVEEMARNLAARPWFECQIFL